MPAKVITVVSGGQMKIDATPTFGAFRLLGTPGPQGIQGPTGPIGPAAVGYLHTQASESATWTIAHNLGFRPAVAPVSVGGVEMIGSITHLSDNTLQIDFLTPVAGSARLV